ncbi:MAG: response regulator [Candidatus Cloacimonetes bacterium]|nr:response regulator [Candidatus Cloacimonadota bacterium]
MIRLLIVDDEPDIIEDLTQDLSDLRDDLEITSASTGYEALKIIMQGTVDIVLTDIAMPDMDGNQLFARTREYNPDLPVIMMTGFGYDPNHVVLNAKLNGLQDVLFKPFPLEKLCTLIDKYMK